MKVYLKNSFTFLLMFLVSKSINAQLSNSFPTNGLMAYYPFNGNANDESGNGNNGVVNGAALDLDRFGNINSAYSFDGSSNFISIPNSPSLQDISSITISAWCKIKAWYYIGQELYFPILNKSNEESKYGKYSLALNYNGGIYHLNENETGFTYDWDTTISKWHHIVFTISNNTTSLYVNGKHLYTQASGVFPETPIDTLPLIIGMDAPGLIEYSKGEIDDIGIWNRALTDNEIIQVYESTGGNVGINTLQPARNLDINNTMRLQPRNSAPSNPAKGDMYFDGILNKLRVFDGTEWQNCW